MFQRGILLNMFDSINFDLVIDGEGWHIYFRCLTRENWSQSVISDQTRILHIFLVFSHQLILEHSIPQHIQEVR